jgi:large subunit ribosomal protein L29
MKVKELRELGPDELERKKGEIQEQIFKLRFQNELGQLENFAKLQSLRKDVARIETILHQIRTKASA